MTAAIEQLMAEANLPALAFCVRRSGEPDREYAATACFQVCCLGKPVTALAMLLLQDEGRLELDRSISCYLPESWLPRSAAAGRITIRQLLTHRAGLIRGSFQPRAREAAEFAEESRASRLVFAPGERYKFSNLGYALCGAILEHVMDRSVREVLAERVFTRLGMSTATFVPPPNVPAGHSRGQYYALVHADDALTPAPEFPLSAASGGFYCSASDYASFLMAAMRRPDFQQLDGEESATLRYTGSNSGYSALALADSERGSVAIAFCNRASASHELRRVLEFASGMTPGDSTARFAGDFAANSEVLRLRPNGRGLAAELGPERFTLRQRGEKTFICDRGPLRERLLRFSVRDGQVRSCSAGPRYFAGEGVACVDGAGGSDLVGSYTFEPYATTEIFVRRGKLYCLCGPLHEARLVPHETDRYIQRGGLFDGEILEVQRTSSGRPAALHLGGMTFVRRERD